MPEILDRKTLKLGADLTKFTKHDYQAWRIPNKRDVELFLFLHGSRLVGMGSEAMVVDFPKNFFQRVKDFLTGAKPETVMAFYKYHEKKNIYDLKIYYYLNRVLHTLFPHNFAKWICVYANSESSASRRTFVSGAVSEDGVEVLDDRAKYTFHEVREIIELLRLPVYIDYHETNFILVDSDKGVRYIDTLIPMRDENPWFQYDEWDMEAITQFMRKNKAERGYTQQEINIVEKSLRRLDVLMEERAKTQNVSRNRRL